MSTATDVAEDVSLDELLDSEIPCEFAARAVDYLARSHIPGTEPMEFDYVYAGECDDGGVQWKRTTICCGQVIFVCQTHYLRCQEGVRLMKSRSPLAWHTRCERRRDPYDDKWVRV